MDEFKIAVSKENLLFAAGHFITFGRGSCEMLHGHNYRVGVTLFGDLDSQALVFDFVTLRRVVQDLLSELDHRMLLPTDNPHLGIERAAGEIEVRLADRRYVFPEADVVILPIANTTAEKLAEYLCDRLETYLTDSGALHLRRIEVEVEESIGQSAWCLRNLAG